MICQANELYPGADSRQLTTAGLAVAHERALRRGDLARAEHLAQEITRAAGPVPCLNADIRYCGNFCCLAPKR